MSLVEITVRREGQVFEARVGTWSKTYPTLDEAMEAAIGEWIRVRAVSARRETKSQQ